MSLRSFHIFFISICVLLAAGFAWWALNSYELYGNFSDLAMGIGSAFMGVGLIVYGFWFLRKAKAIGLGEEVRGANEC